MDDPAAQLTFVTEPHLLGNPLRREVARLGVPLDPGQPELGEAPAAHCLGRRRGSALAAGPRSAPEAHVTDALVIPRWLRSHIASSWPEVASHTAKVARRPVRQLTGAKSATKDWASPSL